MSGVCVFLALKPSERSVARGVFLWKGNYSRGRVASASFRLQEKARCVFFNIPLCLNVKRISAAGTRGVYGP